MQAIDQFVRFMVGYIHKMPGQREPDPVTTRFLEKHLVDKMSKDLNQFQRQYEADIAPCRRSAAEAAARAREIQIECDQFDANHEFHRRERNFDRTFKRWVKDLEAHKRRSGQGQSSKSRRKGRPGKGRKRSKSKRRRRARSKTKRR